MLTKLNHVHEWSVIGHETVLLLCVNMPGARGQGPAAKGFQFQESQWLTVNRRTTLKFKVVEPRVDNHLVSPKWLLVLILDLYYLANSQDNIGFLCPAGHAGGTSATVPGSSGCKPTAPSSTGASTKGYTLWRKALFLYYTPWVEAPVPSSVQTLNASLQYGTLTFGRMWIYWRAFNTGLLALSPLHEGGWLICSTDDPPSGF